MPAAACSHARARQSRAISRPSASSTRIGLVLLNAAPNRDNGMIAGAGWAQGARQRAHSVVEQHSVARIRRRSCRQDGGRELATRREFALDRPFSDTDWPDCNRDRADQRWWRCGYNFRRCPHREVATPALEAGPDHRPAVARGRRDDRGADVGDRPQHCGPSHRTCRVAERSRGCLEHLDFSLPN